MMNVFKIKATGEVGKILEVDTKPGDMGLTLELPDGSLRFVKKINELEEIHKSIEEGK